MLSGASADPAGAARSPAISRRSHALTTGAPILPPRSRRLSFRNAAHLSTLEKSSLIEAGASDAQPHEITREAEASGREAAAPGRPEPRHGTPGCKLPEPAQAPETGASSRSRRKLPRSTTSSAVTRASAAADREPRGWAASLRGARCAFREPASRSWCPIGSAAPSWISRLAKKNVEAIE